MKIPTTRTRAVLTHEQVREILRLRPTEQGVQTMHAKYTARELGVSEKTIRDIWNGRTWKQVTRSPCPIDCTEAKKPSEIRNMRKTIPHPALPESQPSVQRAENVTYSSWCSTASPHSSVASESCLSDTNSSLSMFPFSSGQQGCSSGQQGCTSTLQQICTPTFPLGEHRMNNLCTSGALNAQIVHTLLLASTVGQSLQGNPLPALHCPSNQLLLLSALISSLQMPI
mmetsp:Transcript_18325/g.50533  ORF Transcript_18325/g.50533 Transcript_18325/m.50533 type:complete len:227 (+) Transcript_18325:176-856(+)